jgi:hypothetical protein
MRSVLAMIALARVLATAHGEEADPCIARNPTLADVIARNPALALMCANNPHAAAEILDALNDIVSAGKARSSSEVPKPSDPAYANLLEENPFLQQAYRINPKAVLLQLGEIVKVGGGR